MPGETEENHKFLKQALPEYKSKGILLELTCLVFFYNFAYPTVHLLQIYTYIYCFKVSHTTDITGHSARKSLHCISLNIHYTEKNVLKNNSRSSYGPHLISCANFCMIISFILKTQLFFIWVSNRICVIMDWYES
jgi:hypothetical protein